MPTEGQGRCLPDNSISDMYKVKINYTINDAYNPNIRVTLTLSKS